MMVNIPPAQIMKCEEWEDEEHKNSTRTIVITPLRVTMITEDSCKVSFGCNMWKSCYNENCSYCQAGMRRDKIYENEQNP